MIYPLKLFDILYLFLPFYLATHVSLSNTLSSQPAHGAVSRFKQRHCTDRSFFRRWNNVIVLTERSFDVAITSLYWQIILSTLKQRHCILTERSFDVKTTSLYTDRTFFRRWNNVIVLSDHSFDVEITSLYWQNVLSTLKQRHCTVRSFFRRWNNV